MTRILVCMLLFTATAVAQPTIDDRARTHFAAGKQLVGADRYAEALVEFTAGYELSKRALFLFNMGECARMLGDTRAREYYERYLAAEPGGTFADAARARLSQLAVVVTPVVAIPQRPVIELRASEPASIAIGQSRWKRNTVLVGVGLAVIGGSIALYAASRRDACGAGCVDLR